MATSTDQDQASRPRLSVAMIVRDEEQVLAASIESIRSIADEIVVLDTGSTDQTVAVARQLGALTGQLPWSEDFSAARNHCLKLATGDWILWLDAGERLDEESAAGLREFLDRQADPKKAYMLMVQVPPAHAGVSAEQAAQLRLLPHHPELRFEGRLCETLQPSIEAAGLQIDTAAGRIIRHPRQHDPARKTLQARRDLRLAALQKAESDGLLPARVWLAMGEAYGNLGSQSDARKTFLAALENAEHGSTEMLEAYYGLLTTYDGDEFLGEMQLTTCLEALEVFPFDTQLLLAMGNYLQGKGRSDLAARSFDTAVKYGQVDLATWHLDELAEVAADCLNLTLQAQGRYDDAQAVLEEALRANPGSIRLRRRLTDLHVKHGRCDEALALVEELPVTPQQHEPLRNAVRGACKAAQEDWTAALAYLQSAYLAGCDDPLCLRWLSVTLLSNGQTEAAEPVLRDWRKVDPTNVELQAYLRVLQPAEEIVPAEEAPSAGPPRVDGGERCFRIDQGTTTLEAVPPTWPIISQTSSADMPASPGAP